LLFYLASIGYIGVDVIEGFAQTLAGGRKPSTPADDGRGEVKKPLPEHPQGDVVRVRPVSKPLEVFRRKVPEITAELNKDFDLAEHQIAGILGNLGEECNGFTAMQEEKPLVPGRRVVTDGRNGLDRDVSNSRIFVAIKGSTLGLTKRIMAS
jgi:hypothetical protein